MKKIVILFSNFIFLFFLFCNSENKENKINIKDQEKLNVYSFKEEEISFKEFNIVKKNYDSLIVKNDRRFIKNYDSLKVNNQLYISNLSDNDNMEIYNYYGYWKPLNMDIIKVNYYEDNEIIIQDDKHIVVKLYGIPYINQEKKYFSTYFIDGYNQESYIDLYMIKKNKIKHIYHFVTEKWFPWDLVWNDNAIYLKITDAIWDEKGNYSTNFKYKKLIIIKK
ncbi:hypothetical protein ETU10_01435 [Apibacter muscae]|uniref:hypothetical protein n=1 Tax=Apibacter muscae TaxID=2509004 RepID=UPI0011ADF6EF|nr:hypothetical protein [Apibacter muscae]TWP24648.1 hypothetical protein ETU10_01435 [Apibacter muscae]